MTMILRFFYFSLVFFNCLSISSISYANFPPLQPLVDKLEKGDVLLIPPGTYAAPVAWETTLFFITTPSLYIKKMPTEAS